MKFNATVSYESDFKIEADNIEEAKDIALKSFFEEPGKAELLGLEVKAENEDEE